MHNEVKSRWVLGLVRMVTAYACRTQDISDTIISKEERVEDGKHHKHANHMLWGRERFYKNLQNFVPDRQVDIQWVLIILLHSYLDESGLTTILQ